MFSSFKGMSRSFMPTSNRTKARQLQVRCHIFETMRSIGARLCNDSTSSAEPTRCGSSRRAVPPPGQTISAVLKGPLDHGEMVAALGLH